MGTLASLIQTAMAKAVDVINDIGTTCTYTPKDGVPVEVKAVIRELGNAELVADYRQGDLRVEIDANAILALPQKYDTLTIEGKKYTIKHAPASPRRVADVTFTYKFIVRGA